MTIVLVGQRTWLSGWVRYEIARSLANGNGFIAIDIGNVGPQRCNAGGFAPLGALAASRRQNEALLDVQEWDGAKWIRYGVLPTVKNAYPTSVIPTNAKRLCDIFTEGGQWKMLQMYFLSAIERACQFVGRTKSGVRWI